MKIAITTTSFGKYDKSPLVELNSKKIEYVLNPYGRKLTKNEILDLAKDVDGIIAGTETLSDDILQKLHKIKMISRCGAGTDNIDLVAAKKLGIRVLNTPDGPTLAVAEMTVGLIINLLRKINILDKELRRGSWKKRMGNLLHGKRIGIIGFGRIGQKVAELLLPYKVEINYFDIKKLKTEIPYNPQDLDTILPWADIISIHLSNIKESSLTFNEKIIKKMKQGAFLINVARGGIVDEDALHKAIKKGHIAGAALDVFCDEPYLGPLTKLKNVILTPHIGSYALEARVEMENQAVNNLVKEFNKFDS